LHWVATYTYDAAGRLVGVEGPWVTTSVYDAGSGQDAR
jgi:YD repeat-containing protein